MFEHGFSSGPVPLYYELHGERKDRPPLLLIHGGASTIETNWAAALPRFSATRRVIAVELQGHGRTPSADRPARFESSADDLAGLISELGLGPVDVLGFSNGGQVALMLAMRHPSAIRRLIVASAGITRDSLVDNFWVGLAHPELSGMPEIYHRAHLAVNGGDAVHLRRMFDSDVDLMVNGFEDFAAGDLARIEARTLILGADDDVPSVESLAWAARTIPGARLMIVPGNHGNYLGEEFTSNGDLGVMERTLPWLTAFLDGA